MDVLFADRLRFTDMRIWLARLGWLAIFLLVIGIYINLLHIIQDTASEWQVGSATLRLFDSMMLFAISSLYNY
jgi:hypothetical protein